MSATSGCSAHLPDLRCSCWAVWCGRRAILRAALPAIRCPARAFDGRAPAMVAGVLFVQLLLGAWVAGLNAGHAAYGLAFLMNGRLVPQIDLVGRDLVDAHP